MTNHLLASVDIGSKLSWGTSTLTSTFPSISTLVSVILKNSFAVVSVILVGLLIFGGLTFIMGAGNQDQKKAAQGKAVITDAIIGFLVVLFAYVIVQLIQVITGIPILNSNL